MVEQAESHEERIARQESHIRRLESLNERAQTLPGT